MLPVGFESLSFGEPTFQTAPSTSDPLQKKHAAFEMIRRRPKRVLYLLLLGALFCIALIVGSSSSATIQHVGGSMTALTNSVHYGSGGGSGGSLGDKSENLAYLYSVKPGDSLISISIGAGISISTLEVDNFLTNPYDIYTGQNLTISTSSDPIATGQSRQDQYDQIFLAVSNLYGLNATMMKAQVAQESDFNPQSVSSSTPCGSYVVTGTQYGYSEGLGQITPVCVTWFAWPNGYENGAPDLDTNPNSSLWVKSAFNPVYNIWSQGKIWSQLYSYVEKTYPGCTSSQYQDMLLGVYNGGESAVSSCTSYSTNAQYYIGGVSSFLKSSGV
jgi:LysM repeat protein